MNTHNNKRRQNSQEKIQRIFLQLLQEKPLGQISVSDICKLANLNRSTFYANYADIYALADAIRDMLEQQVSELFQGSAFSGRMDYLLLFRHIRDNPIIYNTYFKLGYDQSHELNLGHIVQSQLDFPMKDLNYHLAFHKAGLNAIIKMWLARGCQETPEEMAALLQSEYRGRKWQTPATESR